MNLLKLALGGFLMALADSVPGVSGGTVAFILRFYDQFITSLDGLLYGPRAKRLKSLKFLVKLGAGWAIGLVLASLLLTRLFETHIHAVSSVFVGFIVFAIPFIIKSEKSALRRRFGHLIWLPLGAALVIFLTLLSPATSLDLTTLSLGSALYIFLGGIVGISAMILPGISGSTILLIMGLYLPILSSVKNLLHFDFGALPVLIIFALGVIVGVALVVRGLRVLLEKHRGPIVYFILGLMLGSIFTILRGPAALGAEPFSFANFGYIWFLLGGLLIFGLERLQRKIS